MINYVAGFMFSEDLSRVALIHKDRPEGLAGLWCGVGGKVENGELDYSAMVREFKEETGVIQGKWTRFAEIRHKDYRIANFVTKGDLSKLRTMESEKIMVIPVDAALGLSKFLSSTTVYLLPLALQAINGNIFCEVTHYA